jgi:hypothetical protein
MSSPNQLSWENFRATVFIRGQQRVHRVMGSPYIEVFGDGVLNRIGIWLETAPGTEIPSEISKLTFITTRTFKQKGQIFLEVATDKVSLQRQFYHFVIAVAERVIVEKRPPIEAVSLELQCFTDLLEEKLLLGPERQLGLLGELVFLERLIGKGGAGALDAWLGPMGEPHDFRLSGREFEVKTTLSSYRIHTINGAEQLVPSKACSLYLVSILLGPAGAGDGFSLSEKIKQLFETFARAAARLKQFTSALEACGFRDADSGHYTRRFALRRPIGLIRVDKNFPAITRPTIQIALGTLASRIESLQYDVSVEGLESEDGTKGFSKVIPT